MWGYVLTIYGWVQCGMLMCRLGTHIYAPRDMALTLNWECMLYRNLVMPLTVYGYVDDCTLINVYIRLYNCVYYIS
jgi:hypothetical protein